jgi:hypothetical protein
MAIEGSTDVDALDFVSAGFNSLPQTGRQGGDGQSGGTQD